MLEPAEEDRGRVAHEFEGICRDDDLPVSSDASEFWNPDDCNTPNRPVDFANPSVSEPNETTLVDAPITNPPGVDAVAPSRAGPKCRTCEGDLYPPPLVGENGIGLRSHHLLQVVD